MEEVGRGLGLNFEKNEKDIFLQGETDRVFLDLANQLNWTDDLKKYVHLMAESSAALLLNS
eukprot:764271-Hanusia_phi.AAC.4